MGTPPSPLLVEIGLDGSLLLSGELDIATVTHLEEAIAQVVKAGTPVVIDMDQLTFIDSCGIEALARTHQQTGERVVIRNPPSRVRKVLEIIDTSARPNAWVILAD